MITVYAKDSLEPRKASFYGSFGAEVQNGNIRYLFPEGCEAPSIFFDPINRAENRKKFIESLQEEALKNQRERNIAPRRNAKKIDSENDEKAQLKIPSTEAAMILTTASPEVEQKIDPHPIETQQGTAEPVDEITRSNFNENSDIKDLSETKKNLNDELENLQADAPKINNDDDLQCCDNDRLKIILPRGDSCRMAKISIPISADKLAAVSMKDLINLSSAKSTLLMLQNLLELVEKYNL